MKNAIATDKAPMRGVFSMRVKDRAGNVVYEYEEKYGQGSFDDWLTRFEELSPYPENWKEWDDLYPGWECVLYINRDLEPEEEEEEC